MTLPYDYVPAVLFAIEKLSQGNTLTRACDLANVPIPTFHKVVNANPEIADMYADAQQRSYDAMADALVHIHEDPNLGSSDPKIAAVISKNIMWYLEKKKPKEYGQRVQVDTNVSIDIAITTALDAARTRVGHAIAHVIEDAVIVETDEDRIARELLE